MPIIAIGGLELIITTETSFQGTGPCQPALRQAHHAPVTSFSPQMRSLKQPDAAGKIEHRKRRDCPVQTDGAALP